MDYLQYKNVLGGTKMKKILSFKPYYKWITFNTLTKADYILPDKYHSFKPYYKWITFNTNIYQSCRFIKLKF